MEVSGQIHDPAALPPGKEPTWYPLKAGVSSTPAMFLRN